MSTMITQSPKGVEDWYGERMHKRTAVEKIARKIAKTYHMSEIITPIFEHTILFQRGVGETTDVVQKEMYTFSVKSERSITLKPEGTAGVIRAYLEHGMYANSGPTKLFYVTPAFRYEQPQHGRLRQHHQFGVEFIGSHSPLAEVEVITLAASLIKELGLKDVSLHINSIGCKTCRKIYNEALLAYLNEHEGKLCKTCKERMKKNPLRVLDCKEKLCHEIVKEAPRTIEYLDEECQQHFQELQDLLVELNIPFTIDTGIVRGLDYYTKTVFEFVNKEGFTLCGGGRYDGLIHEIDEKQDIPSVGFGMGIERILYFLEQENIELEKEQAIDLYIGILGKQAVSKAYKIVTDLRNQGYIIETDYMEKSIKAQMKYANKIGAKKTVIIGENELETQLVSVKDMETGENTQISLKEIGSLL
jgi:histidyl-tRNA synthetase